MDAAVGQITPTSRAVLQALRWKYRKKKKKDLYYTCSHRKKHQFHSKALQNGSFIFYRHVFADLI